MVGPSAMLVAFVVRYAIWPNMMEHGRGNDPTGPLKLPRVLILHNVNVLIVLTEISLLGGLPVRTSDFAVSALFGVVYVLFSWSVRNSWAPTKHGPQFLYFFLDTTLGATTTFALLALLIVLMVFYGLFCGLHAALDHLGGGIAVHVLAVVLVASLVCRFRD